MKKTSNFLLIILFLIILIPVKVFAAEQTGSFNGINWSYKDGTLTLTTNNPTQNYKISNAEGNQWGRYKQDIKKIIIF